MNSRRSGSYGACKGPYKGRIGDQLGSWPGGRHGQLHDLPARPKVESSNIVIICMILVCQ